MNHRPHYPPPESQQQNNDPLGQDLHAGSEIVMIFVAIFGLWKYIVVPLLESVIVPSCGFGGTQKLQHKAEADSAGLACLP